MTRSVYRMHFKGPIFRETLYELMQQTTEAIRYQDYKGIKKLSDFYVFAVKYSFNQSGDITFTLSTNPTLMGEDYIELPGKKQTIRTINQITTLRGD